MTQKYSDMGKLYEGARKRIHKLLLDIYPEERITDEYMERLHQLIEDNLHHVTCSLNKWDETDTVLITYANSIMENQTPPLQTLHAFMKDHLKEVIRNVHILSFTLYSSDHGISAIDYYRVNPTLGTWQDLQEISKDFKLMADLDDLNFSNPEVLLEMLRVLFFYINKGIRIIRLDTSAYLRTEMGSCSSHLPQTHHIVKLIRELAELVHPDVIILTNTNMPDRANPSHFGKNNNEAHMIYQFPLPPLLLHALHTGSSKYLTAWARQIPEPGSETTYFNFTASHNGIDLRPAEGLIPREEIQRTANKMKDFGGHVSTKTNTDGSESPSAIHITYYDALKGTSQGTDDLQTARFICSQTIMMCLRGIPAFYIHSLTATQNDHEGVTRTGKYRSINRKSWDLHELLDRITDEDHPAHKVFTRLTRLMRIRRNQPAFHPESPQQILDLGESFFVIKRTHKWGQTIWSLSNVGGQRQQADLSLVGGLQELHDLISEKNFHPGETPTLEPYQTMWLTPS